MNIENESFINTQVWTVILEKNIRLLEQLITRKVLNEKYQSNKHGSDTTYVRKTNWRNNDWRKLIGIPHSFSKPKITVIVSVNYDRGNIVPSQRRGWKIVYWRSTTTAVQPCPRRYDLPRKKFKLHGTPFSLSLSSLGLHGRPSPSGRTTGTTDFPARGIRRGRSWRRKRFFASPRRRRVPATWRPGTSGLPQMSSSSRACVGHTARVTPRRLDFADCTTCAQWRTASDPDPPAILIEPRRTTGSVDCERS